MQTVVLLTASIGALGWAGSAQALDSVSIEYATGREVELVRLAAQWNWQKKWLQANGRHVSGYWDLSLAQWRASSFRGVPGATQRLVDAGFTPVFRWQRDDARGLYLEGGIGAHYLSEKYDNDGRTASTNFQFGSHLGVGYIFQNRLDLGMRLQHLSNGGIDQPNPALNFASLRLLYRF